MKSINLIVVRLSLIHISNIFNEVQRIAVEDSRLGIPLINARDVIHGFKTIFPIPLGLSLIHIF